MREKADTGVVENTGGRGCRGVGAEGQVQRGRCRGAGTEGVYLCGLCTTHYALCMMHYALCRRSTFADISGRGRCLERQLLLL
jgi:hypothetical protein